MTLAKINPAKSQYNNFLSLVALLVVTFAFIAAILFILNHFNKNEININQIFSESQLPKFASCSALYDKLKETYNQAPQYRTMALGFGGGPTTAESISVTDYSQTNIQVSGVDEADIVKTDGSYIYTVSGQNITIVKAYPANEAKLMTKISYDDNSMPSEIFIDKDNLMIFGSRSNYGNIRDTSAGLEELIHPSPIDSVTFVEIYHLANPEKPELKRRMEFEGNYFSSRKINNYVYFVLNDYPDYRILEEKPLTSDNNPVTIDDNKIVPLYRDLKSSEVTNDDKKFEPMTKCGNVSYVEPINADQYLTVVGIPIDDYDEEISKEVILGGSQNIYASFKNLYVANTTYQYPEIDSTGKIIPWESKEETVVYKFALSNGQVKFLKKATVPGTVLNQFSMDEYNDYFRIATTIGHVSQTSSSSDNNVYILDKSLNKVGSLEDIAPGEKIYSARFIGGKAYLVTFKKVDPFFTIDVFDPKNPKIIGKLKIPGYSDYLHPYDENHIIGIGKETEEAEEGDSLFGLGADFAWYQGMKMAIFDVTDFANPKELSKVVIGDRGTDSPILSDHKAFLFNKDKNLLALPILLAEINPETKKEEAAKNTYGDYIYQGTYVYKITLDKGFELLGRITHYSVEDFDIFKKSGFYFGDESNGSITRNLYIEDNLYSISNNKIKINSLSDLSDKGAISLK